MTAPRPNALKTHCPKGHAYAGDNLYTDPEGLRRCKSCRREAVRRFRAKAMSDG